MRLLVTGAAGMLGTEVVAAGGGHDVVGLARADLDITDAEAVRAVVRDSRPDAVINCAAYTNVDAAESDEPGATAINGAGAGHVAAAAAEAGAHVVHVSTDYVFAGDAREAYVEDAPTGPRTAYGRSKLEGERRVAAAAPHAHAIVRTAWLFGPHGTNFVDTMLRLGAERDELSVVDDQIGCPTYAGHLAAALVQVAAARTQGVLHAAGQGACSWFDLARATFERAQLPVTVHPCTTADFPRPAPRPAYSVIGSTRRDAPVLPPWQDGLAAHLSAREVLT